MFLLAAVHFSPNAASSRAFRGCFYWRPCTSPETLQAAVHFACFLAGAPFRARKSGKCTSEGPPNARLGVHFRHFPAGGRALRLFPCTSFRHCKDLGEVHVIMQEKRGSARPRIRSARHHARKAGKCTSPHSKCTSSCKKSGEVHVSAFEVHVVVHGLWRSAYPAPKARPASEVRGNAQELEEAHSISRSV